MKTGETLYIKGKYKHDRKFGIHAVRKYGKYYEHKKLTRSDKNSPEWDCLSKSSVLHKFLETGIPGDEEDKFEIEYITKEEAFMELL